MEDTKMTSINTHAHQEWMNAFQIMFKIFNCPPPPPHLISKNMEGSQMN